MFRADETGVAALRAPLGLRGLPPLPPGQQRVEVRLEVIQRRKIHSE